MLLKCLICTFLNWYSDTPEGVSFLVRRQIGDWDSERLRLTPMAMRYVCAEGVREETYQQAEAIFLPTKACMMIASLVKSFPSHSVLLADFHALPDVKIQGKNAPLVAATVSLDSKKGHLSGPCSAGLLSFEILRLEIIVQLLCKLHVWELWDQSCLIAATLCLQCIAFYCRACWICWLRCRLTESQRTLTHTSCPMAQQTSSSLQIFSCCKVFSIFSPVSDDSHNKAMLPGSILNWFYCVMDQSSTCNVHFQN